MRHTDAARRGLPAVGLAALMLLVLSLGRDAGAQAAPKDPSVFEQLGRLGFHLQRAVGSPDGDTPATFSFLHSAGLGTVYNYDFALLYAPPDRHPLASLHRTFQPSIEGKIASDDSSSEDAWRFRLSFVQDQGTLNADAIDPISTYTLASIVEENDRDFRTEKLLGEFLFTPTIPAAYIGEPPHGKRSPFLWRPFFGVDYGTTLRRGDSQEVSPTVFRLLLRTRAYLFLNGLQQALGTHRPVYLFADDTLYDLPIERESKTHNFFVSGLVLGLSPNVSLGLTYKAGAAAPNFQKTETFGGDLGVTF